MSDIRHLSNSYDGLRSFLAACEEMGELKRIDGADWRLEINTLTEALCERTDQAPAILWDNIKDYPKGFRVASLVMGTPARAALALGLDHTAGKLEIVRAGAKKIREMKPIPPVEVPWGPVMENTMTGADIDMARFPVLLSHENDGGRYIGTGDTTILKDPESDYVNIGTYRIQMHGPDRLGLFASFGQHGQVICKKYWDRGQAAPIAVTFGGDPLVFWASHTRFPWGASELDRVGGVRGAPLEIVKGPLTGLPIPAHAEIAIEGEVPPPEEESADEGPFGEWPGYYTGGILGIGRRNPVIRVKAVYWRNDPILIDQAPQWPGAPYFGVRFSSGELWHQLEQAGVPDVVGVNVYNLFLVVVAIRQRYAGHARQAGMAVLGCAANASLGRYVVIVDEDIDPTNIQEVLWAMETRVDPASDIQIVDNCWAGPLDPRLPPDKRLAGDRTMARAIFQAVRPFQWKDKFPMVNRASRESIREVMEKYKDKLPFPKL